MIDIMESPGSNSVCEDRIAALEKKVNEMGALLNGLMEEFLDLKSIDREISRQTGERNCQDLKQMQPVVQSSPVPSAGRSVPAAQGDNTIPMNKDGRTADAEPQAPAEPLMDMIMQTDGTMKPEYRRGNYIVASPGSGPSRKGFSAKVRQSKLS